jgi:thiol-disulfide isomerase/thioredoxin
MKTKKKILLVFIIFSLIACNDKELSLQTNITLNFDRIELNKDSIVYINKFGCFGKSILIDSFKINTNNNYVIKKEYEEPFIGYFSTKSNTNKNQNEYLSPSLVFNDEKISVELKKHIGSSKVTGVENEFYEKNQFILYPAKSINSSYVILNLYKYGLLLKNQRFYNEWNKYQDDVKNKVSKFNKSIVILYALSDNKNIMSDETLEYCLEKLSKYSTHSIYLNLKTYLLKRKEIRINKYFPNLKVKDTALRSLGKINFKGNKDYYVIDFWASWCGPCRLQTRKLNKKYHHIDTTKIQIISVSIDEDPIKWKKALKDENFKWQNYLLNDKDKQLNIFYTVPTYILLNKEKKIIAFYNSIDSIQPLKNLKFNQ